jgi:transglutaminase/protease-like cytokinesis protein 3
MKEVLENLTMQMIEKLGFKSIYIITEKSFKPRMVLTKTDDTQLIIDGENNIVKYLKLLLRKDKLKRILDE